MQLELPQRDQTVSSSGDSPISKNFAGAEENQGPIPEFILNAIGNFKEGREYFESGHFRIARNKFLSCVQNLARECPKSPLNDSEPTDFCVQDSIDFVENICTTSYEQIRSLCQSPISRELRKICLPSASHIDRISTTYRSDNNTSTAIDMCEENPSSEAKLKGIICAVLCDALSALSSCEEVLGDYVFARALHASLAKLQKLLYGEDTIHCAISLRSLERFFDALGCSPDEAILTKLDNPFLAGNMDNAKNDESVAHFLNNVYLSDPERFTSAIESSQPVRTNNHNESVIESTTQQLPQVTTPIPRASSYNRGNNNNSSSNTVSSTCLPQCNFSGQDEYDFFTTFE